MSDVEQRPDDRNDAPQGGSPRHGSRSRSRSPPRRSSRSPPRRSSRSPPRRSPSPNGRTDEGYKLYIGNLDFKTTADDLRDHFRRFGDILDVFMPRDGRDDNRGFGFVTFRNRRDAEAAESEMNERDFQGRTIRVNFARPRPPPSSYSSSRGGGGGRETCRDFQRGRCFRGGDCKFSHDDDRGRGRSRSRSPPRRRYRSRSRSPRYRSRSRSPRYRSRSRSPGRR